MFEGVGVEVIAELVATDPQTLTPDDRVELLVAWQRQVAWAQAQLARVTVAVAGPEPELGTDGDDWSVDEVRAACRLSSTAAHAQVHTARDLLSRLPRTLAALESGRLDYWQAVAVSEETGLLDDDQAAAVEASVLAGDRQFTTSQLKRRLRRRLLAIEPDIQAKRAERARAERTVERWATSDSMGELRVAMPLDQLQELWSNLTAHAQRLKAPGDCRSLGARRVDALLDWSRRAASQLPPGVVPSTQIAVKLTTLLHEDDDPGEVLGAGPVPAEVVRQLAADGAWVRWLCQPESGRLLDIGARTYRPSAALARFVAGRDVTCRFPGCNQPASRCHLDHADPFRDDGSGGDTVRDNLSALCEHHHRLKHETEWKLSRDTKGTVTWTSPTGRKYRVEAEDLIDKPWPTRKLLRQRKAEAKQAANPKPLPTPPSPVGDPWLPPLGEGPS